ncbi:hypothetical protein [Hugenholtzia roseola]|uniref:hypothetical protein n=1 Tax=Hugenholtzia roseola TaxID=1002 RepID=UPI000418EAD1|nr:hypothetical protein [Hugenholtzia roseola]
MLTLQDLILTPLYFLFVFGLVYTFRNRVRDKEIRKYFLPAFLLRVVGAIFLGLIYQFYYGAGDTTLYFQGARKMGQLFEQEAGSWAEVVFGSPESYGALAQIYSRGMPYSDDHASFMVSRIAGFCAPFAANTYSVIALFFASFSFFAAWKMYQTWIEIYPNLKKELARAVLFLPSVIFWGAGLMKDSLTFSGLALFFTGFYWVLIRRRKFFWNAIYLLIGAFLMSQIKLYIFLVMLPACGIWFFYTYKNRIKSQFLRIALLPILLAVGGGSAAYFTLRLSEGTEFALDRFAKRTKITAEWIYKVSDEGSRYDVGELDGTFGSMLRAAPLSIFVALYRPFIWESRNPNMLLAALECSYFIWLTLLVLRRAKLRDLFKFLSQEPQVVMSLFFALVFGFFVGVSSSNFGTLVRYKIPLLPFFVAALYIILAQYPQKGKKKRRPAATPPPFSNPNSLSAQASKV